MDGVHQMILKSIIHQEIFSLLVGVNQLEYVFQKPVEIVWILLIKSIRKDIKEIFHFYLAPSRTSNKTLPTTPNKQNGNIRQQQSKNKKTVISPVSNDSSYSPTTMDEKNNNLTTKKISSIGKQRRSSTDLDGKIKKERPIGKDLIRKIIMRNF